MLSVLELIGWIVDIFCYLLDWRFSLCLFGSCAIAVMVAAAIPSEPPRWILGGAMITAGFTIGLRWDRAHRQLARESENKRQDNAVLSKTATQEDGP